MPGRGYLPIHANRPWLDRPNGFNIGLHNGIGDRPEFSPATQTEKTMIA